jgi:hypothetical protein
MIIAAVLVNILVYIYKSPVSDSQSESLKACVHDHESECNVEIAFGKSTLVLTFWAPGWKSTRKPNVVINIVVYHSANVY